MMKPAESADALSPRETTPPLGLDLHSALSRHLHDLNNLLWPVVVQAECAQTGSVPQPELLSRIRNDVQEALNITRKISDLLRRPVASDNDIDRCPALPSIHTSQSALRPLRILCVDGHPDAGAALSRMLMYLGNEVELARTGSAALAAIALRFYDVVLTDMHLADMSGRELTRRLRESAATPVIWMAGVDVDSAVADAPELVVPKCILTKPVSLDALRKALGGIRAPTTTHS